MTIPEPSTSTSAQVSPPPLLLSDDPTESTNTAALLLPHLALFSPSILEILRDHYEKFGVIAHWAPVKAFGRVIIVWQEVEGCELAKRNGDYLKLDVDLPEEDTETAQTNQPGTGKEGYFKPKSAKHKPTILRLYSLPFTPLNPDPAALHLAPPAHEKNFLISPPGSPPEGWEPIIEDGPNTVTLAEDLQRALESLALNGLKRGRRGSKEVILEEGGVRVEVEDTSVPNVEGMDVDEEGDYGASASGAEDQTRWDVEERLEGQGSGMGVWEVPGMRGGSGSALGTPMGKMKMIPTARPPM